MTSDTPHPNVFHVADGQAQQRELRPLGEHVRRLRKQRGLTLRELARQVGVSPPALCRWEKGQARPRGSNIQALADAFKISPAVLLDNDADHGPHLVVESLGRAFSLSSRSSPDHRESLPSAIAECKRMIAKLAGTSPDRVRITIEV